jgi:hypothetical protein
MPTAPAVPSSPSQADRPITNESAIADNVNFPKNVFVIVWSQFLVVFK